MKLIKKIKKLLKTKSPEDVYKSLTLKEKIQLEKLETEIKLSNLINNTIEKLEENNAKTT